MRANVSVVAAATAVVLGGGFLLGTLPSTAGVAPVPAIAPRQGLSALEQRELFHLPQGAELLPIELLDALEDPKTGKPFMANLERFGLLDDPESDLPIGVALAKPRDLGIFGVFDRSFSFNCASCHVGEVRHNGKSMRILGGQSFVNAQIFAVEVKAALSAVVKSPASMAKFLARLLGEENAARKVAKKKGPLAKLKMAVNRGWRLLKKGWKMALKSLKAAAKSFARDPVKFLASLKSSSKELFKALGLIKARIEKLVAGGRDGVVAGPGRIDSFGGGLWRFFPRRAPPPNAPVSYAPLWDIERTKWYHWDGNTDSALERNIGNAVGLGVYYDTATFASTLRLENVYRLEEIFRKLRPPKWPVDVLGAVDKKLAAQGKPIYEANCASCHEARAGEMVSPQSIGTDPARARTNLLEINTVGTGKKVNALLHAVEKGRAIVEKWFRENKVTPEQRKQYASGRPDPGTWRVTGQYRIPYLTSIWATAPYLHNGSVPTLHDLLLPPQERPKKFLVGSYNYDPVKVGYVTKPGDPGAWELDTAIPGNLNTGHTAGTDLSPEARRALLEYLKTK